MRDSESDSTALAAHIGESSPVSALSLAVLHRIAQIALQDPDRTGIYARDEEISYSRLWKDSGCIATALQARLGDDSSPVGIAMARGPDLVSAVLGVLRSGRAYVPLDVNLPSTRLAGIVELAAPALTITDAVTVHSLLPEWKSVLVGELTEHPESSTLVESDHGSGLAYIIFTSGSTGVPKGIEMRGDALGNLMTWQFNDPRLGRAARTLMSTPLSFDVSFQEILGCLATGGALVLLEDALRRDPPGLIRMLKAQEVERIYLPFVALQQLAEAAIRLQEWPLSLRDVITAGEQLQITDEIIQLFSRLPHCRLHNHYGPAETHVVAAHTLGADPVSWPVLPPIGRPIAGVKIYLLDEDSRPVKPGQVGEFFLAGSCLARGYVKDPELTAQRFVPDPFATGGSLMYKTSDLGRENDKGEYEWIGRNDSQVKIRGYRVELGEVELAISSHPAVRQAVVVSRKKNHAAELVAYITTNIAEAALSENVASSVEKWRNVWDRTYEDDRVAMDPTFDVSGWNSSYTGEPIALDQMREWVDAVASRIRSCSPERVLEIGSGSGLILFQLAAEMRSYVGLDFSEAAIRRVRDQLRAMPTISDKVELQCRAAHELEQFEAGSFDMVVINSVTQHFPSADYLIDVLRKAATLLSSRGTLIVGDVASLPLRRCFLASIEREKSMATQTVGELLTAVEHRLQLDTELVLDAKFFLRIPALITEFKGVEIHLKRGSSRNEMTNYRFDVLLRRQESATPAALTIRNVVDWRELPQDERTANAVLDAVKAGDRVCGIGNDRLSAHWQQLEQLGAALPSSLVSELVQPQSVSAIDPEILYRGAEARGIDIELRPASMPFRFDVALTGHHDTDFEPVSNTSELGVYASDPLLRKRSQDLIPELRQFIQQSLPDFMQPASYVVVSSFPLTASGKIYRAALPAPSRERPPQSMPYVAPGTELEVDMAALWCEVLELESVGLDDSFFDLGGNSLLSHELSALIRNRLTKEISPLQLFSHPTIRALSASIESSNVDAQDAKREGARSRGANQRRAFGGRRPSRPRNLLK